jgi:conjugative transfer signal peptidase TraF
MTTGRSADSPNDRLGIALRIMLTCVLSVIGIAQLWDLIGLRVNTSPSLPVGFYITTSDPGAPLVEFCPAEPYAHLAIVRGYRSAGSCHDGAAPLLKPVVAKSGDTVDVSPMGIAINGRAIPNTAAIAADTRGRHLPAWPYGRYLVQRGDIWVASSFNPRSFDSRYFGPVPTSVIRDHVRPMITFGK